MIKRGIQLRIKWVTQPFPSLASNPLIKMLHFSISSYAAFSPRFFPHLFKYHPLISIHYSFTSRTIIIIITIMFIISCEWSRKRAIRTAKKAGRQYYKRNIQCAALLSWIWIKRDVSFEFEMRQNETSTGIGCA